MSEAKQMLFARNVICICIEKKEGGDYIGLLWHQYSYAPIEFNGVSDMLMLMDDLFDEWDFPQRGLDKREFNKSKEPKLMNGNTDELVIDKVQAESGIKNVQNKKGTLFPAFLNIQRQMRQKPSTQTSNAYPLIASQVAHGQWFHDMSKATDTNRRSASALLHRQRNAG